MIKDSKHIKLRKNKTFLHIFQDNHNNKVIFHSSYVAQRAPSEEKKRKEKKGKEGKEKN